MAGGDLKRLMIPFKGIEQRAKYEDGAMRDLMNLRVRDGVLRVCPNPQVAGSFGDRKVEFMHFHKGWLLYVSGGSLYAVKCGEDYALPEDLVGSSVLVGSVTEGAKVTGLEVLGNLVCVVCDEGVEYALWKDGKYKWLGRFPELVDLRFMAVTEQEMFAETLDMGDLVSKKEGTGYEFQQRLQNVYLKKIYGIEDKLGGMVFTGPVLVRYAYKLFDGSYVMHSSPVLLMSELEYRLLGHPKRNAGLLTWLKHYVKQTNIESILNLEVPVTYFNVCGFKYIPREQSDILRNWKDIIMGVSIYVSDGLLCSDEEMPESVKEAFEKKGFITIEKPGQFGPVKERRYFIDLKKVVSELEKIPYEEGKEIEQCGTFYHFMDIELDDLLKEIDVSKGDNGYFKLFSKDIKHMADLKHREVMSNVSYTHHRVGGMKSYVFNNRLRLADVREVIYRGHGGELGLGSARGYSYKLPDDFYDMSMYNGLSYYDLYSPVYFEVEVDLVVDGQEYKVSRRVDNWLFGAYLSYPDPRARRMTFRCFDRNTNKEQWKRSFDLKPHATLDIAYYLGVRNGRIGLPVHGRYWNGEEVVDEKPSDSLRSVWQGEQ